MSLSFRAGDFVGGYQLESILGAGATGIVYRARAQDGRVVALKLIGPDGSRERFQTEAETLSRLDCQGVPRIFDYAMHPIAYLAEEVLEGLRLEDRLAQGPIAVAEALAISDGLLTVLQVIHENGFVHRDLSPGNILLQEDQICIIDFGLVRIVNSDFHPTQTGEILGTPHYLAPEQIDPDCGPISPATDIFAAGALVYRMLTGVDPIAPASLPRMMRQILQDAPPSMQGVGEELEGAVLKALEKHPASRYSSALEFAQALRTAAKQKGNS